MFAENDIYFPGLRAYVGYKQAGVKIKRKKRLYGKSRVRLMGLVDLSIIAFFGFSECFFAISQFLLYLFLKF